VVDRGVELLFRPDKEVEPRPDLWLAWRLHYSEKGRSSHYLRVIARLRPGVTLERAQSEADAVAGEIGAIDSAYRGAGLAIHLQPMQPFLVAYVRPAILALMGAVMFLLLIACSNVTNLFLVRHSLRSRDLAIRTALGASWWRLARQMLAEALFVSALGSAMGFGLAWAGVRQLLALAPPNLPRLNGVRIDVAVLAFSIGAGLFASVLFALAPALRVARHDVAEVLRAGSRTGGLNGGLFIRNFIVVAEVALCFVLLVGSGLMFRSFLALQGIRPGYDPHNLLTFRIMGGKSSPTSEGRSAVVRQMQSALSAIPGVQSVTAATILPLTGSFLLGRWGTEGAPNDPSKFQSADMQFVIPGYFATMRTQLLAGRDFNASDHDPHSMTGDYRSAFFGKSFSQWKCRGAADHSQPHKQSSYQRVVQHRRGRGLSAAHLAR
jgi:putative ABC transport system permease protein